jgi:hypothetical protein
MAALAKKCDLQIISDYFARQFDFYGGAVEKEGTVGSVLKSIGAMYGKRLKKTGTVVTLEDRKWAEKRSWQVPDEMLSRWKALGKKGKLAFEDLVEMASLTDPQIDKGLTADPEIAPVTWTLTENRYILRFYAGLSDLQKQMLRTPDGLAIASLPAEQRAACDTAMEKYKGTPSFTTGSPEYKKQEVRPDSKLVMKLDVSDFEFDKEAPSAFYSFVVEDRATIDNTPPEPDPYMDSVEEPSTSEDAEPSGDTEVPAAPTEPAVASVEEPVEEPDVMEGPHFLQIAEWSIHIPGAEEFAPPKPPTPMEKDGKPQPGGPDVEGSSEPVGISIGS